MFFPETFTLGEALTISQGVTFLIFDITSQILHKVCCICIVEKCIYLLCLAKYFVLSYAAKHLRGKTFAVGTENDLSRENVCGRSFF